LVSFFAHPSTFHLRIIFYNIVSFYVLFLYYNRASFRSPMAFSSTMFAFVFFLNLFWKYKPENPLLPLDATRLPSIFCFSLLLNLQHADFVFYDFTISYFLESSVVFFKNVCFSFFQVLCFCQIQRLPLWSSLFLPHPPIFHLRIILCNIFSLSLLFSTIVFHYVLL
jgi:hypothetical protein